MKKPQTERAMRRRESASRLKERAHCPKHGAKIGPSALAWRCGCPTR